MNEQFKEQITYKAREFATAYTNQLFTNEPAFSFGHEGWAKFVVAMVKLAGAHPDKGTSALAAPVVPAPGAIPARIHVTEAMHRAAVKVLHRASGLDGLPQRMMDAMLSAKAPQAAPVAQLSEPPEGWVLLPPTPTEEMFAAFCNSASSTRWEDVPDDQKEGVREGMTPAYQAMLAAAPTTPKDAAWG